MASFILCLKLQRIAENIRSIVFGLMGENQSQI